MISADRFKDLQKCSSGDETLKMTGAGLKEGDDVKIDKSEHVRY